MLQRATKHRLSPNRQRGVVRALSLALYGVGVAVFAHSDVVEQPFLSEHLTNFGTYIVLSGVLIFTLSIRLATPRISNGLGLFLSLILCNAAQLLFSVFMSDNGTVLALSPLIYLVSALCTAWYFLFRLRRLRILFRVFGLMSVVLLFFFSYGSYLGYVYVMMLLSLSWYLFLISIEVLACVSSSCRVLVRKLASMPQLRDYRSYITLWLHLFTRYLILPIGFLIVMWYSLDWPANCLNLAHYLETWISMEYEFNTIIKSLSAGLVLHKITVGIVTNCILRLVQRTLIALHAHKHEGGGQLTLVTVLSLVVWHSYIIYCLMLMKANYESILVILGGMSVGIGLGLKDNIENFISGISLMLGRLRVGDTVECGVYRGRVTSIGFRTTTIETFCGSTIIFQNKELFNDKFRNMTHNNQYERRVITVGIAYGTDIDHARRVILGALAPLTDLVSQQHPYYVALSNFGASSIDLSVYVWLPVQGRPLGRSTVREAIYRALTKNDISIPFPQQDLYIKQAPEEAPEEAPAEEPCPRFSLL